VLYSVLLECLFESVTEVSHLERETNKAVSKKIKEECRFKSVGPELKVSTELTWTTLLIVSTVDTLMFHISRRVPG
jgi:hypothetical protein